MQYTIQAKPTKYKGVRFRSRLEAKWAAYFSVCLNLEWYYEPRVVALPWCRYIPDFWLPKLGAWAEVKPRTFDLEAFTKADELYRPCILLDGEPEERYYYLTRDWPNHPDLNNYDTYAKELNDFGYVDLVASAYEGRLWYSFCCGYSSSISPRVLDLYQADIAFFGMQQ